MCKLLAVGSLFFWQLEHPPLAVGTYTTSGNSLLAVGMACAFYSQHKLKGKAIVNEYVPLHYIDHELLKIVVAPLAPKLRNNRTAHTDYLRHTQEETATLREIVESKRLLNPLNTSLDYALNRKIWQPTGKMFTTVGHIWKPTGRTFTLVGNVCPLTRIATTAIVPFREHIPIESNTDKHVVTLVYSRKSKAAKKKVPVSNPKINKSLVVQIVLWYLDSDCSKHMTGDRSQHINFVHKFLGTVKFGNDHVEKIMGYGDYKIGNVTISKTPYELLHNKLPDLSFLYVFGALCYPTNDSENLGKLQLNADIGIFIGYAPTKKAFRIYNRRTRRIVKTIHVDFDELTAMASEQRSSGSALNEMTPVTINSGLVQKSSPSTSYVPPSRNDWDLLFQPMFDELLNPPPSVDHQAPKVIAPIADVIPPVQADSTGPPSSTTVDQDAPSLCKSHTTAKTQSLVIPQDVEEDNLDIEVAHMVNDPLFGVPIPLVTSAQSSSTVSPHTIIQPDHQIPQHISKWKKDHPLQNIIGQLSKPVSTRLQLHEQALFCYYDAFLTSVEPKMYKEALTQSCWIEAMQEDLNEFERLETLIPLRRILGVLQIGIMSQGCREPAMRYYGEDSVETGPPRVIVYGYDGLPIQPVAPPSLDYVSGPEHLPSLDYMPGPEHPLSHVKIPYVPEPEYLAPSDDEAPLEN
uniref:Integrase, catalytic region, zinc finger, CCHC-type, peptidase aspartic, catalytic n=1 Tax=Tanacetum cinerariifolium TaxID=118510 RepID=A0A6L2L3G9_TANCI|nr:hypothetical protein [Tanacetum cinerariifolium]